MIEVLVAGAFLTAAVAALSRRPPLVVSGGEERHDVDAPDLPCPWCEAPTREEDHRCPSCGQRFG